VESTTGEIVGGGLLGTVVCGQIQLATLRGKLGDGGPAQGTFFPFSFWLFSFFKKSFSFFLVWTFHFRGGSNTSGFS
jgi:hypothetical protein